MKLEIERQQLASQVKQARSLVDRLLGELDSSSRNGATLEQLGMLMSDPEGNASQLESAIQENYRQAISMPSRIDGLFKLVEAMKTLNALEAGLSDADRKTNKKGMR